MRYAQLNRAICALIGQIDIVHAHDFAAAGIDDLLIEQILAHGEPTFIRRVVIQSLFLDVELDHAGRDERDVIVARHQRQIFAAPEQNSSDAIRLVGRFEEQFVHATDEVARRIVGVRSQKFRGVQHEYSVRDAMGKRVQK